MKFLNITLLFVLCCLLCHTSFTLADGDAAKRIALRRPIGKPGKSATTAAPPPPAEQEDEDYNEGSQENQYGEEGDERQSPSSTSTTTTEAPKKVGPVIRPFRSNYDFLNSLKRRQQSAKKNREDKIASHRNRSAANNNEAQHDEEAAPEPTTAPAKSFKSSHTSGHSTQNRRKAFKPSKAAVEPSHPDDAAAEESEHQQKEAESKPKRPLPARLPLRRRI